MMMRQTPFGLKWRQTDDVPVMNPEKPERKSASRVLYSANMASFHVTEMRSTTLIILLWFESRIVSRSFKQTTESWTQSLHTQGKKQITKKVSWIRGVPYGVSRERAARLLILPYRCVKSSDLDSLGRKFCWERVKLTKLEMPILP